MCLSSSSCILISTIIKTYAILSTSRHGLSKTEPELVIPRILNLISSLNHDTAATVYTNTILDLRGEGIAISNLCKEAAVVIAFHVTVGNDVVPTNRNSITSLFEFHSGYSNISPVGTLDSMQVTETLVLNDSLQVNNINIVTLGREVL